MMKGRAAVFSQPGRGFEIREFPLPEVEPDAVLIQVSVANICGSDLHVWRGETQIANADPDGYVFGHEMSGIVSHLGKNIQTDSLGRKLTEGDRVVFAYFYPCHKCWYCLNGYMANCPHRFTRFGTRTVKIPPYFTGAFGEYYYLRPGHYIFKAPSELTDEVLGTVNCIAAQVMYAFSQVEIQVGDQVVVQGAGGLGLYACMLAKEKGASRVTVIDRFEDRLHLARAFGADETLLIEENVSAEDRRERILVSGERRGADLVVEAVGLSAVIPEALNLLRPGGTLLLLGCITPGDTYTMDPTWVVGPNKRIIGLSNYEPRILPVTLDFLLNANKRYPLSQLISHRYPLEDINQAFAEVDWVHKQNAPLKVIRASIIP